MGVTRMSSPSTTCAGRLDGPAAQTHVTGPVRWVAERHDGRWLSFWRMRLARRRQARLEVKGRLPGLMAASAPDRPNARAGPTTASTTQRPAFLFVQLTRHASVLPGRQCVSHDECPT